MSDKGLEAPDADAAEQDQDVLPEAAEDGEEDSGEPAEESPLEADAADVAEQARVLRPDDDEYR